MHGSADNLTPQRLSRLESHIGFKLESILQCILRARDSYTQEHCQRVVTLAEGIGRHLGLSDHDMDVLSLTAGFHDIGKIGIPDNILLKSGTLSAAEYEEIKRHPVIGASMLRCPEHPLLDEVAECILHHHEHWNGQGYPLGLKGERIPVVSRIVAVVDSFDAMTTARSYRAAIDRTAAIRSIVALSGAQFSPEAAQALQEISRETDAPCD